MLFDAHEAGGISLLMMTLRKTQPSVKLTYCLSTIDKLKKALIILSKGDLEEKQALILEDKAPSLINQDSKVHMTS